MPRLMVAALACAVTVVAAQEQPLPNFDDFVAQVKKHLQTDAERQTGYAFTERRTDQRFDASGRVKDQKVRVFEVYPALPGDSPYERLIEENGKPLPQSELDKQDRERQKKAEAYLREQKAMTDADRQKQLREYEKAMKKRADEVDDALAAFDIRMLRREQVEGQSTIVFSLTPKANARPHTDAGRILQHFSAQAWISESDHELVRIRAQAVDTVTFGFGLLARIDKGTTFAFERRKVNGEIWLPALSSYKGTVRLVLVPVRVGSTSEFSNYRKFSVETTTEIGVGSRK